MKRKLLCVVASATALFSAVSFSTATPVEAAQAHDDQITRLYITALGRYPETEGHEYWSARRVEGESLIDLARVMINLPEAQSVTSGDFVVDAYRNALSRFPDAEGHAHWLAYDDPARAVAWIADSEEHQQLTGTLPPPLEAALDSKAKISAPEGWVDAGNGVYVPKILLAIRFCESRDSYVAANPRSSARGAYQFLTKSWAAYGHSARYGVSSASLATPAQQDEAAVITWQRSGTRPWNASRHCWG